MLTFKHEIKVIDIPKIGYPKLMKCISDSTIILFSSKWAGTVIVGGGSTYVGYHSDDWNTGQFEDLPVGEEITLSNKEGY